MATQDVPGANPKNHDTLAVGNWAEHEDGSLIFVKGVEHGKVVYEIYDLAQSPPIMYPDAMLEDAFKRQFSFPPVGDSDQKWTWHDKTAMPWSRVMKSFDNPRPVHTDPQDVFSAAQKVAESLRLRAKEVRKDDFGHMEDRVEKAGRSIVDRVADGIKAGIAAFQGK